MCGERLAGVQKAAEKLAADSRQQLRVPGTKFLQQEAHGGSAQVSDRPVVILCGAAQLLGHYAGQHERDDLLQVVVQRDLLVPQQGAHDLHISTTLETEHVTASGTQSHPAWRLARQACMTQ